LAVLVACLLVSTVATESQGRREKFAERSQHKGFNPRLKKRSPEASPKYIKRAAATTAASVATAPAPTATTPYVFTLLSFFCHMPSAAGKYHYGTFPMFGRI